jgi:hypothetical protein
MSSIRDAEAAAAALPIAVAMPQRTEPDAAVVATLPRDHPHWFRDTVSISSRARTLLARLRPVVVAIVTFWDHALRTLTIGGSILSVDPSGSYRLD